MHAELVAHKDLFKALSEETRLQILALLLWSGELCVCDIEKTLEISQSKASRHLRYLYNAGLVQSRRQGLWVSYQIAENPGDEQREVLQLLRSLLAAERLPDLKRRFEMWLAGKAGQMVCRD